METDRHVDIFQLRYCRGRCCFDLRTEFLGFALGLGFGALEVVFLCENELLWDFGRFCSVSFGFRI